MNDAAKKQLVLAGLSVGCLALAGAFLLDLWGRPVSLKPIPPLDPIFTNTATVRVSGAELVRTGGDASGLDCYTCHDKEKRLVLHLDAQQNIILPDEHKDLTMGHGRHNRNNHCFNCHDETNLELLQTRDGRPLKLLESSALCGSCHGPTFRDWEAGAHGRISGSWSRTAGQFQRQDCVSCHDPHAPKFPPQKPAPRPHPLRSAGTEADEPAKGH
jgi:formate-dependent nitrite reductase cytochrome c552 subunit